MWHCVQVRVFMYAIRCECVVAVNYSYELSSLPGCVCVGQPGVPMCGAAVEPAGTGGVGH